MPGYWSIDYPAVPVPNYRTPQVTTLPDLICCVYFLWRAERCVYVGQTKNLRQRLRHHKKYLPGDVVTWINFSRFELADAEQFYIWLLHPPRNYRHIVKPTDKEEKRVFPMRAKRATFQP